MMLIRRRIKALTGLFAVGLLLTMPPTLNLAQDQVPAWLTFRIHTVKPDQTAAWEALMKERRDAEHAAGRPFRRVFQRIRGIGSGYLIQHLDGNVGEIELANVDISPTWGERLSNTLDSSVTLTVRMYPELTANLDRWLTRDTDMMFLRIRTSAPGRAQDYFDWQANQLFPALAEAGVSIRGGRIFLGQSDRTWVRLAIVEDWAALTETNPVLESRDFQRMIAADEELTVASENLLYRYRADLSYVNPP